AEVPRRPGVCGDVDAVAVVAQSEFEAGRAEVAFADPEQAGVTRFGIGHEGFGARRGEVALRPLQAEGAFPAAERPVRELKPALDGFVVAHGADLAALAFGVGVVGVCDPRAQALEGAAVVESAAELGAALVHLDVDAAMAFGVVVAIPISAVPVAMLVLLLVPGMDMAGYAVARVEQALADADETAVADPGQAQGAAVRAHEAVVQRAARVVVVVIMVVVLMLCAQGRAFGVAGNLDVTGLAMQRV